MKIYGIKVTGYDGCPMTLDMVYTNKATAEVDAEAYRNRPVAKINNYKVEVFEFIVCQF